MIRPSDAGLAAGRLTCKYSKISEVLYGPSNFQKMLSTSCDSAITFGAKLISVDALATQPSRCHGSAHSILLL